MLMFGQYKLINYYTIIGFILLYNILILITNHIINTYT